MLTVFLITFREFFEAFLLTGVFLGISKKMNLKKEKEILLAAGLGMLLSLTLASVIYVFGEQARGILTEDKADILESYLLIFSGIFIAYVVFSLHARMKKKDSDKISETTEKLKLNVFDFSLFGTILFMVLREGFEVALFTSSTVLFSQFMQNFIGLLLGFFVAAILGISLFFAYIKVPVRKIFKYTEYGIVLVGASLVQNGIYKLLEHQFDFNLSHVFPFTLPFLPDEDSMIGHAVNTIAGFEREFSWTRLSIMVLYMAVIYLVFLYKKNKTVSQPV